MGLDIDPAAMQKFATETQSRAGELRRAAPNLMIGGSALGSFSEATALVGALNSQLGEVHDRVQAVAQVLVTLSSAASTAASMASQTDAQVHQSMKQISSLLSGAEATLAGQNATLTTSLPTGGRVRAI